MCVYIYIYIYTHTYIYNTMTLGKLVIKCPRKPRVDLWKSRGLRGHLIANFPTCHGISL